MNIYLSLILNQDSREDDYFCLHLQRGSQDSLHSYCLAWLPSHQANCGVSLGSSGLRFPRGRWYTLKNEISLGEAPAPVDSHQWVTDRFISRSTFKVIVYIEYIL